MTHTSTYLTKDCEVPKREVRSLNSISRASCRLWGSTVWVRKNFADVRADFVVILGMLHENRRNRLSGWAFDRPFFVGKSGSVSGFASCSKRVLSKADAVDVLARGRTKFTTQGWIELLLRSGGHRTSEPGRKGQTGRLVADGAVRRA